VGPVAQVARAAPRITLGSGQKNTHRQALNQGGWVKRRVGQSCTPSKMCVKKIKEDALIKDQKVTENKWKVE